MNRRAWLAMGAIVGFGLFVGCKSGNAIRPASFQKNGPMSGPELGSPMDGPYLANDFPSGVTGGPPTTYPPGTVIPGPAFPPGAPPPVQIPSFPPTLPQGPPPVPQGPPPRLQPTSPTTRNSS